MPALLSDVLADPTSYPPIGWLLLGLAGIAAAVNQFLGAAVNVRKLRSPGPEETEVDAKFAALTSEITADMRQMEMRVEKRLSETIGSINTRLASLEATLAHVVADFNYALGKIDGRNS